MKRIRTVLGDIDPSGLGIVYSHEHLLTDPPAVQTDRDLELSSHECSLRELALFKERGGTLLVEATTLDYGRDPAGMARLSREADVPVVAVTGFNKAAYHPLWVETTPVEGIAERMVRDVVEGMDGGSHKAGHLKSGGSYQVIRPTERKTTLAVAQAWAETRAPIWLHTEAGTMGLEMLDILEGEGVDPTAVVVGHSDRNADPYYHRKLAERGAYVQFDGVSKVKYHPDSTRVGLIRSMVDNGHAERLLVSGDMGRASYLTGYGGGPGFSFIIDKFMPRLLDEGIDPDAIDRIFKTNPVEWLARF